MAGLQTLIESARESCEWRGHELTGFQIRHGERNSIADAECKTCGMWVQVDTAPLPNGIDIAGTAVALNCKD